MLQSMRKIENKLEVILKILKSTFPWNEAVRNLAKEYSKYDRYISKEIYYLLQLEDIVGFLHECEEIIDLSDIDDVPHFFGIQM